jgi:phenylalanine ammonia-lyase
MFDSLFKDIKLSVDKRQTVNITKALQLTIPDVIHVSRYGSTVKIDLTKKDNEKINYIHQIVMSQVRKGIPIYGVNAAYGARVELVLNGGNEEKRLKIAKQISNSIIHVDVSTGPAIEKEIVRAAILLRINTLLAGHSGVRVNTISLLERLLNLNITPIVGQYGSLGASGDLAMNGRVLATLMQLKGTKVFDNEGKTKEADRLLREFGIAPLELEPKEGLALANGDNFSTASALFSTLDIVFLMLLNTATSALTIQALKGSTRNFHPLISELRPHPGQELTSLLLRSLLKRSKLAYQDLNSPLLGDTGQNIQDPYSIRCLPQYYGSDWEALLSFWKTLKININSVSDNPLWTTPENTVKDEEPYQWVSGGNFLAMHMVELLDRLRKVATHIVKQNDRHLTRLVHPKFNNGLPANLSDKSAISQTTFKGLQNQMGMYEVYSTVLADPVSTKFGNHEEFNQDLTSHAFTSGILAKEVIKIARYAIATNLIASCQAIDLRGGPKLLSPKTKPFYEWVRNKVPYIKKEQPLGHYLEDIAKSLMSQEILKLTLKVPSFI